MSKPLYAPWPTASQRLLLDAALADGPRSLAVFDEWLRSVDLEQEIGWSSVRLLPLAYQNLARHGCTDPRMGLLKGVYRRVWLETNQLFHRTAPLLRAFHDAGVDLLLLKGAPIALAYYRNFSLRAMSDIDVCVERRQIETAARVLDEQGWKPCAPLRSMIKHRHALEYRHEELGSIDLHWHVLKEVPDAAVDERFWAASEPLDFLGIPVRQLHPEDAFLHTVIHGLYSNHEPPIRWITDSLAILSSRGTDIDWHRLLAFAERHRLLHRLATGILYLVEHHGVPVPDTHVKTLRGARASWVDRLEMRWLFPPHPRSPFAWAWKRALVRYCRTTRTRNPLKFAHGYLVFSYGAETPRELAVAMARTLRQLPFKLYRRLVSC
ncbi:MAG: nucleotidyltransferase family protein [Gemmatimonadota bacterium]